MIGVVNMLMLTMKWRILNSTKVMKFEEDDD